MSNEMKSTRERVNGKKKVVAATLAALLLIGAGMTAAYFTDYASVTNEFTVGQVKTELTEPKWDTDDSGKKAALELRPNMTIVKDPTITNVGTSDAFAFISFKIPYDKFAAVGTFGPQTINGIVAEGLCSDFNVNAEGTVDKAFKDLFMHKVNSSNWILVETTANEEGKYHEYVYAYATGEDAATGEMTALKKSQKTPALFVDEKIRTINLVEDKWATANGCVATENQKFEMPVKSYTIQTTDIITTDGLNDKESTDPAAVWKVVKAQVNSKYGA